LMLDERFLKPLPILNNEALAEPHRIHATPPQREEEEMHSSQEPS